MDVYNNTVRVHGIHSGHGELEVGNGSLWRHRIDIGIHNGEISGKYLNISGPICLQDIMGEMLHLRVLINGDDLLGSAEISTSNVTESVGQWVDLSGQLEDRLHNSVGIYSVCVRYKKIGSVDNKWADLAM